MKRLYWGKRWVHVSKAVVSVALLSVGAYAIPVYNPSTGHSYEVFEAPLITWVDARAAAESKGGYLATLTDAAENQFVFDHVVVPAFGTGNQGNDGVQAWIGGFQPDKTSEPDGGWQWVTGEAWSYTNWGGLEPNNAGGGIEDHLTINRFGDWTWNDEGSWMGGIRGYIVEYENIRASPLVLPLSASSCLNRTANC